MGHHRRLAHGALRHVLRRLRYDFEAMKTYTPVVQKDPETNLYVGWIPGFPGAHSQGETPDELNDNLREVVEMLLES